jgi:polysaccharide export outer membrane protein
MVVTFALLFASAAMADYRMMAGDTVEVSVYGAPDLRRRAVLNVDGQIILPIVGTVKLAGLSLSQGRERLRDLFARDGSIANADVTVEIVEHRPFYISGDVSKPGSYPYRPGMTTRQAIAVAGGLDVLRMRLNANPLMEAADLRNEFESLRIEFVKQQARIARLQAELAGKAKVDFGKLNDVPIPAALYAEITGLETKQLETRLSGAAEDRTAIERARNHVVAQLAALQQQQTAEAQGVQQQTEDAAKVKAVHERGLAPLSRVIDEQRMLLLSKGRLSATMAQVLEAKRTIEELGRQLNKADETLRLDILRELQEGYSAMEKTRMKMQTVAEKLAYVGTVSSVTAVARDAVRTVIYRRQDERDVQIEADPETEIAPGDALEIALKRSPKPVPLTDLHSN